MERAVAEFAANGAFCPILSSTSTPVCENLCLPFFNKCETATANGSAQALTDLFEALKMAGTQENF